MIFVVLTILNFGAAATTSAPVTAPNANQPQPPVQSQPQLGQPSGPVDPNLTHPRQPDGNSSLEQPPSEGGMVAPRASGGPMKTITPGNHVDSGIHRILPGGNPRTLPTPCNVPGSPAPTPRR